MHEHGFQLTQHSVRVILDVSCRYPSLCLLRRGLSWPLGWWPCHPDSTYPHSSAHRIASARTLPTHPCNTLQPAHYTPLPHVAANLPPADHASATRCRTSFDRIPSRSSSPAPALACFPSTGTRRAAFAPSVLDPAGSHHPTSHHSSKHGSGTHAPHQRGHHSSGAGSTRGSRNSSGSGSTGGLSHNSAAVKWAGPLSVRLTSAAAACCAQLVQQGDLCEALSRRLAASRLAVLVVRVVKEAEGAGKGGCCHHRLQEGTHRASGCHCLGGLWTVLLHHLPAPASVDKGVQVVWPGSAAAAAAASCMYACTGLLLRLS